mgnify:CR=1 FL=1
MKTFNEIDEPFVCEKCGFHVDRLGYSCRDHCPNCLYSKHVDKNPGDRKNKCQGLLKPIGIEKFKGFLYREIHTIGKQEFLEEYEKKCRLIND